MEPQLPPPASNSRPGSSNPELLSLLYDPTNLFDPRKDIDLDQAYAAFLELNYDEPVHPQSSGSAASANGVSSAVLATSAASATSTPHSATVRSVTGLPLPQFLNGVQPMKPARVDALRTLPAPEMSVQDHLNTSAHFKYAYHGLDSLPSTIPSTPEFSRRGSRTALAGATEDEPLHPLLNPQESSAFSEFLDSIVKEDSGSKRGSSGGNEVDVAHPQSSVAPSAPSAAPAAAAASAPLPPSQQSRNPQKLHNPSAEQNNIQRGPSVLPFGSDKGFQNDGYTFVSPESNNEIGSSSIYQLLGLGSSPADVASSNVETRDSVAVYAANSSTNHKNVAPNSEEIRSAPRSRGKDNIARPAVNIPSMLIPHANDGLNLLMAAANSSSSSTGDMMMKAVFSHPFADSKSEELVRASRIYGTSAAGNSPQNTNPINGTPGVTETDSKTKRKTGKRDRMLTEDEKRRNHISSEKRRRTQIKMEFDALCDRIPFLQESSPLYRPNHSRSVGDGENGDQKERGKKGAKKPSSKCDIVHTIADYLEYVLSCNEQLRKLATEE